MSPHSQAQIIADGCTANTADAQVEYVQLNNNNALIKFTLLHDTPSIHPFSIMTLGTRTPRPDPSMTPLHATNAADSLYWPTESAVTIV